MTDDELKIAIASLKVRTNWGQLITVGLLIAGAVWTGVTFLSDIPKRAEYKLVTDDVFRIRIDQTTMNGRVERMEQSQARIEKAIDELKASVSDGNRQRRR